MLRVVTRQKGHISQRQRDNLLALAARGKTPAGALGRIGELDAAIEALGQRLADGCIELRSDLDRARLRKGLRQRLGEFRDLISSDVPLARQGLRKLLDGQSFSMRPRELHAPRANESGLPDL